ncbi:terminase small subunit protein [Sphingomicrobium sp. XHP0235]|uniref:terminase small subunit-like protein n=1 Tax=Sphingomicrobium aquimarinum TaxID=3133971 RepID=UPI0031FF2C28
MGRPSDYNEEIADTLCERIADGESLRSICRDDTMPSTSAVCRWLQANEAFRERYAHARELQADALFDDCLALADGVHPLAQKTDAQFLRLQVDTRKWMAGKLKGKYSDKVKHVGGDEGDAPIAFTGIEWSIVQAKD